MDTVSKVRADEALRLVFRAKPNSSKWAMGAKRQVGKMPKQAWHGKGADRRMTRKSGTVWL